MPEQPPPPAPEATPGLVRASTNALALTQRTSAAVDLTQLVQREASAAYWFEQGLAATQAARWDEAVHAYRQCVERDAQHWRAGVRLAGALGQLGQAEAAAEALTEVSDEVTVESWRALVAELPEPIWHHLRDCLEAARSTAQNGFDLLLGLALVYRALKQGEQARRTLDVMQFMYQQQAAGSARWFRLSGNLYFWAEIVVYKAIVEYSRAIQLKPDYAFVYFDRGYAKPDLNDYHGAATDFSRVIELKPNYVDAYKCRGEARSDLKEYAEAIADFDRVIELKPDDADAYRKRGDAKRSLKNYAGAIADYDRTIELKPDYARNDSTYRYRAFSKEKLGDIVGADTDHEKADQFEVSRRQTYKKLQIGRSDKG